jgi:hypothetical protein
LATIIIDPAAVAVNPLSTRNTIYTAPTNEVAPLPYNSPTENASFSFILKRITDGEAGVFIGTVLSFGLSRQSRGFC